MVTIELTYRDNDLIAYSFRGHAMSRRQDEEFDLVCAAVSVLAIAFTNGLTEVVGLEPETLEVDEGLLRCTLPSKLTRDQMLQTSALTGTMLLALENLAADYAKHVRIVRRRCAS